MLLQRYQWEHEPPKKTVAVDKENTPQARGPVASEDTASSNENKASCKSRPSRDWQTQASWKPTARRSERDECSDGYKTAQRIEALWEHVCQRTTSMQTMYIMGLGTYLWALVLFSLKHTEDLDWISTILTVKSLISWVRPLSTFTGNLYHTSETIITSAKEVMLSHMFVCLTAG